MPEVDTAELADELDALLTAMSGEQPGPARLGAIRFARTVPHHPWGTVAVLLARLCTHAQRGSDGAVAAGEVLGWFERADRSPGWGHGACYTLASAAIRGQVAVEASVFERLGVDVVAVGWFHNQWRAEGAAAAEMVRWVDTAEAASQVVAGRGGEAVYEALLDDAYAAGDDRYDMGHYAQAAAAAVGDAAR